MSELERMDLVWCVRRLPKDVRELIERHGPSVFLAGGFIRACVAREDVNDIDLFTTSKELARALADNLALSRARKVYETGNAYSVDGRPDVQFIHRWSFATPEECVRSFDFTIASAAIWYREKWESTCAPRFYADLAAKRLVYMNPERNEDAGGSFLRLLKFYARGYRAPLDTVGNVVARLVRGVEKPETLSEHQLGAVLTGLLRVVDPAIDPTHNAHIPSDEEKTEGTEAT